MRGMIVVRGRWIWALGAAVLAWSLGQPPAAAGVHGPSWAITVDGVGISREVVESEWRYIENPKKAFHAANPEREAASLREAVDRVIVWELVRQKLAAAGKLVTDAEVEVAVAGDRQRIGDSFPKYIAIFGQNEASFTMRKRNILNFKKFVSADLAPQQKVSESEIKESFEKAGTFWSTERYSAEYLQLSIQDKEAKPGEKSLNDVAAAARAKLLAGASVEEAAKAFASPRVVAHAWSGVYDRGQGPVFEEACLKLKPGEVSEPLTLSGNLLVIVRLKEHTPSKILTLDEARPEIRGILQQVKSEQAVEKEVERMKAKAKIVYVDPKFAPKKD